MRMSFYSKLALVALTFTSLLAQSGTDALPIKSLQVSNGLEEATSTSLPQLGLSVESAKHDS